MRRIIGWVLCCVPFPKGSSGSPRVRERELCVLCYRAGSGRALRAFPLQITMGMRSLELWLWLLVLPGSFSADVTGHGLRAAFRARKLGVRVPREDLLIESARAQLSIFFRDCGYTGDDDRGDTQHFEL